MKTRIYAAPRVKGLSILKHIATGLGNVVSPGDQLGVLIKSRGRGYTDDELADSKYISVWYHLTNMSNTY